MTSGCRFSFGTLTMRTRRHRPSSKLNITLPAFSALPSIESVTSNSFSGDYCAKRVDLDIDRRLLLLRRQERARFGFSIR